MHLACLSLSHGRIRGETITSNQTKNTMKTIPTECLDTLPDGYCILGWGGKLLRERAGYRDFEGVRYASNNEWTVASFDLLLGVMEFLLYAAPANSDVAKAMRKDREMPIDEWLKTLPNGWRQRAIANVDEGLKNQMAGSLHGALGCAFQWENSPEGSEYWGRLYDSITCENIIPDYVEPDQESEPLLNDEGWIPLSERKPTKEDFDISGRILVANSEGHSIAWLADDWGQETDFCDYTHWKPTGVTSLPPRLEPAMQAFDEWYQPAELGSHIDEQRKAFIAGFEKGRGHE